MMHHTYRIIIEDIDGEDVRDIQKAIEKTGWDVSRIEHMKTWSDSD